MVWRLNSPSPGSSEEIEDVLYVPRHSETTVNHIPTLVRQFDSSTRKSTVQKIPTFPPSPPETERETSVKEYRVPDITLVVSQPPTADIILAWAMEEVEVKITAPVFSAKEATVPVIIEVNGRRFDDPLYTMRALVKVEDQLLHQAGFLFSDFESLEEVIAIAGVGIYWR